MNGVPLPRRSDYDVVVVGARCAGAATAMLLARSGLRVLAVDRSPEGSDTLSTHALMRGAVLRLSRWGLLPALERAGTPAIRTTTFHYGGETVAIPIQDRDGVDALRAPRRTVLDPLLVAAAREAGAEVVHGLAAVELSRDRAGRVSGVTLSDRAGSVLRVGAGLVVGADGYRSAVARMAGAGTLHAARSGAPVAYRYVPGLGLDGFHWHYREGISSGAIPTNDGLAAVFVTLPAARWARERAAGLEGMFGRGLDEASPGLAALVRGAAGAGPLRAFDGTPGFVREAHGPGWALVGDAGFFRDPITAHGITDALRDAEWLATAVVRGTADSLADYQAARDALARDLMRLSEEVAAFEWSLERVRALHLELSRLMNREVEAMRAPAGGRAA